MFCGQAPYSENTPATNLWHFQVCRTMKSGKLFKIRRKEENKMFIIRFIVLLPFRILAFVLSLILTIIRVFIDITAKHRGMPHLFTGEAELERLHPADAHGQCSHSRLLCGRFYLGRDRLPCIPADGFRSFMKTAVRAVSGECFFRYCPLFLHSGKTSDALRLHSENITHRIKSAVQKQGICPINLHREVLWQPPD